MAGINIHQEAITDDITTNRTSVIILQHILKHMFLCEIFDNVLCLLQNRQSVETSTITLRSSCSCVRERIKTMTWTIVAVRTTDRSVARAPKSCKRLYFDDPVRS